MLTTHDEVVEEFLRAEERRVDDAMLDVACLGELLNAGWQCVGWIDGEDRIAHQANVDWFVERARRALERA